MTAFTIGLTAFLLIAPADFAVGAAQLGAAGQRWHLWREWSIPSPPPPPEPSPAPPAKIIK